VAINIRLKLGDTGPSVKALQLALGVFANAGITAGSPLVWPIPIDGVFGQRTTTLVRLFQQTYDFSVGATGTIPVTGRIGPDDIVALARWLTLNTTYQPALGRLYIAGGVLVFQPSAFAAPLANRLLALPLPTQLPQVKQPQPQPQLHPILPTWMWGAAAAAAAAAIFLNRR